MGVSAPGFVTQHKDKVDEMKRLLLDYAKALRQVSNTNIQTRENTAPADLIQINENGYPILPDKVDFNSLRKSDLEEIIRTYLGWHYRA